MRYALFFLLLCLTGGLFGQNNIVKTVGICYTAGPPTVTPSSTGCEYAVDTVAMKMYWRNRDGSSWIAYPRGVDVISGTIAPAYTPRDNMALFAINADSPPELYYYNGSAWVLINDDNSSTNELQTVDVFGLSGTVLSLSLSSDATTNTVDFGNMLATRGVDSAWVKTSGSYLNKRITDNVYRYGTTSLRSNDTSGILNIYAQAQPKAAIYTRYSNATANGFLFFQLDPDGQTNNSSLGNFNFWGQNFDGVNAPYSTRANHVWRFGYNTSGGGGRVISTDADLHIAFESNFYNIFHRGGARRAWEWHLQSQDTIGGVHRMITARGSHDGVVGELGLNADLISFADYNSTAKGWLSFTHGTYTKGLTFLDTAILQFKYPQVGVDLIRSRNAANSADLSLMQMDASNRVVFPKSIIDTWSYSAQFIFNTLGTIATSDGNPVQIGNSTYKSFVSIYAPSTEVLRLRSNTGGADLWRTYVNSDHLALTRTDDAAYLSVYETAPAAIWANSRWGWGTSPGARFHIRQDGNGGGNGLQMTNSDASFSVYQAVDASGRYVWYQTGGATRMVLDQSGKLAVGTTTNPVSQLDVEGGATIGATYAGTDAAPTNGAIIEGNVGIGNNSPSQKLHITGNLRVTGAYYDSNNDAGSSGQVLSSTVTGTDWITPNSTNSTNFTRTLPTTVGNTVQIGFFAKTQGAADYRIEIVVPSSGVSIAKTYIVSSFYNGTAGAWQILLPITSTGAYSGNDFQVEIKGLNLIDSLRIRRTAGTSAATAYVDLYWSAASVTTFTALSGTDNPTTITATYSLGGLGQVANKVGINNTSPARDFHVTGEVRITDLTTDTPIKIVGADADGDLDTVGIGAEAELHLTNGTLGTNLHTTISPSSLTAGMTNNWNPTGLATAWIIRMSGDDKFEIITGITAPSFAKRLILHNTGANAMLLATENTSSTAGNRFSFGRDVIVFGGKSVEIIYDVTTARWRLLSKAGVYDDVENQYFNTAFQAPVSLTTAEHDFWEISSTGAATAVTPTNGLLRGVSVNTGTSATGCGDVASKEQFVSINTVDGAATWGYVKAKIVTPSSLSNGTNDYALRVGFLAGECSGDLAEGAYFYYNHAINSGAWSCYTQNAGSSQNNNSGVTVAASTIYVLEVVYRPNISVEFFINGTRVATNDTNVPDSDAMKVLSEIEKQGGTTQRDLQVYLLQTSIAHVN